MPTEIEHIEDFEKVQAHDFENLVLLCSNHHREVTSRRVSKHQVRSARARPFGPLNNIATYQPLLGQQTSISFGSVQILSRIGQRAFPFSIKGFAPIEIELGTIPKFSFSLSSKNGKNSVVLVDNTFAFRPSELWDVRLSGTRLLVKHGQRRILLDASVEFGQLTIKSMRISSQRVPIVVDSNGIHFPLLKSSVSGLTLDASSGGIDAFFSMEGGGSAFFGFQYSSTETDEEAWEIAQNFRSKP